MPRGRTGRGESRLPDAQKRVAWVEFSLENPLLRIALGVVFGVALIALLSPSQRTEEVPAVNTVAQRPWVAPHAFTVTSHNPHYEREVREAESQARFVYEHTTDRGERNVERVAEHFVSMRALVTGHTERMAVLQAGRSAALVSPDEPGTGRRISAAERVALKDEIAAEWDMRIAAEEKGFKSSRGRIEDRFPRESLAGEFGSGAFDALLTSGFLESAEIELSRVVREVTRGAIVGVAEVAELRQKLRDGIQVRAHAEGSVEWVEKSYQGTELDYMDAKEAQILARNRLLDAFKSSPSAFRVSGVDEGEEQNFRAALTELVGLLVENNFIYHAKATAAAQDRAADGVESEQTRVYQRGQTLVEAGELVTDEKRSALTRMAATGSAGESTGRSAVGVVAFVMGILFLCWLALRGAGVMFFRQARDLILFGTVIVLGLAIIQLVNVASEGALRVWEDISPAAFHFAAPVAVGAMLVRLFLGLSHSVAFAILQTLFVGLMFMDAQNSGGGDSFPHAMVLYTLISGLAGSFAMYEIRERSTLGRAGLLVGACNVLTVIVFMLLQGWSSDARTLHMLLGALSGGILDYIFLMALIPSLENLFRYTTDIKLLELANMNQPSLKELAMRAPGTYHHSIMVGNLAESAAEAIGANPLLTRVGAYYHDLGKMRNPRYFAENQAGENPHHKLKPSMSALIIKSHVKDGIEIARNYKLPQDIIDFIPQHHGTALISYFYVKAKENAEAEEMPEVDEESFRYPGPRPQRKETAVVMLADSVEASARALPDPNPQRLKQLVKKIVTNKFIDGQLDECDISFRDLNQIVKAFNRVLISMYHGRPEYPADPAEQRRPERDAFRPTPPGILEVVEGGKPAHSGSGKGSRGQAKSE